MKGSNSPDSFEAHPPKRNVSVRTGRMLIHFSEHVGNSYVEGCIGEIEEMGALVEPRDQLTFTANVLRPRDYPFVVEFLRHEERVGNLRLETVEE